MKDKKILIITPNLSRTGAPKLLLNYLSWHVKNSPTKVILISESGGAFKEEFSQIIELYILEELLRKWNKFKAVNLLLRALKKLRPEKDFFFDFFLSRIQKKNNIKLILFNTAVNEKNIKEIKSRFNCKAVTFIHEGPSYLKLFKKGDLYIDNLKNSDRIICVSNFVYNTLIRTLALNEKTIVIPGFITEIKENNILNPNILKKENKIPTEKTIIMCCGWLGWHKGTDFFIQLANKLKNQSDFHLVWIGGDKENKVYQEIINDINYLQLENTTIITDKKDIFNYLNLCDIFLVLSREESFSLVTLESIFLKKPVFCFETSGGPCEIIDFEQECVIPFADIDLLCKKMIQLNRDKSEIEKLGLKLFEKVSKKYDISTLASIFHQQLNELIIK